MGVAAGEAEPHHHGAGDAILRVRRRAAAVLHMAGDAGEPIIERAEPGDLV